MPIDEQITEKIKGLGKLADEVSNFISAENFSVQFIRDEVNFLDSKKNDLLKVNKEIEKRNELLLAEGEKYLQDKKAEAEKLLQIARETMVSASIENEKAKKAAEDAQFSARMQKKKMDELLKTTESIGKSK